MGLLCCRDEVAGCSEQAYDQLSLAEAQKMMFLTSSKEMQMYAEEVMKITSIFTGCLPSPAPPPPPLSPDLPSVYGHHIYTTVMFTLHDVGTVRGFQLMRLPTHY